MNATELSKSVRLEAPPRRYELDGAHPRERCAICAGELGADAVFRELPSGQPMHPGCLVLGERRP